MWQRKIDLNIIDKDTGKVLLSTSENRIDFVYQGNLSWMADTLTVDVYNLDPTALKMLLDTKNRQISMRTGYMDEPSSMSTLLNGYVVNVAGRKAMPHHITTIWCVPFSAEVLSQNAGLNQLKFPSGTLKQLIVAISKSAGYSSEPRFFGMDEDVLNTQLPAYTLRGNVTHSLSELGEQFRFYVRGTNSDVQIVSMLNSASTVEKIRNDEVSYHKMTLDKLKGVPQATVAMIDFTVNLDAGIDAGDIVNVAAFLGARPDPNKPPSDGVVSVNNAGSILFYSTSLWAQTVFEEYMVLYLQHVGSNYAQAWETRITGVQYNEGLVGNKEVSGNGNGTGTWDISPSKETNSPKGVPSVTQSFHSDNNITSREASQLSAVQLTPQQNDAIDSVARGNTAKGNFLRDKLIIENRGQPKVRNVKSEAGASGPFQIMPETGRSFGMTINDKQDDRNDFNKSAAAMGKYYDELDKRFNGDVDKMNINYNSGERIPGKPLSKETEDYVRMARYLDRQRSEK